MAFIIRVMTLDTHRELVRAWRAINAAPEPARSRALDALQDLRNVTRDRAAEEIKQALTSKNKVDEIALARDLGNWFRDNYARAEKLANAGEAQASSRGVISREITAATENSAASGP
jgi:hypothetical protein